MSQIVMPAPVRKSVRVNAPPDRAFEVFTTGIGRWWPKSHHIGASELETHVIEPKAGEIEVGGNVQNRQRDPAEQTDGCQAEQPRQKVCCPAGKRRQG